MLDFSSSISLLDENSTNRCGYCSYINLQTKRKSCTLNRNSRIAKSHKRFVEHAVVELGYTFNKKSTAGI